MCFSDVELRRGEIELAERITDVNFSSYSVSE